MGPTIVVPEHPYLSIGRCEFCGSLQRSLGVRSIVIGARWKGGLNGPLPHHLGVSARGFLLIKDRDCIVLAAGDFSPLPGL